MTRHRPCRDLSGFVRVVTHLGLEWTGDPVFNRNWTLLHVGGDYPLKRHSRATSSASEPQELLVLGKNVLAVRPTHQP